MVKTACCGPKSKTQTDRSNRSDPSQLEVGPDKVKYPTHDGLGFLESKYKLILSSVFKSS